MWARSLSPSRLFATPARELKDRLDSRCLLPLTGLEPHPKQQKQIQPQHAHKMPVARSSVQSAPSQHGVIQFSDHADQAAEPTEHVQSVSDGQHIEERVADVRSEPKSLGFELH